MHPHHSPTAMVLSGGGARGAYEAGVVAGLVDVLGHVHFDMLAGTSVGAINAAYLASHAHLPDMGIATLLQLWTDLSIRDHLRPSPHPFRDRSMLDVRPFERIVNDGVDWSALANNLSTNHLQALFVAALEVESGRTAVFVDLAPSAVFHPSKDPQRVAVPGRITASHVLASAAIPGIFPPRGVGKGLFYDGGLRFNTPLAPVLRAGAHRVVVVSPLFTAPPGHVPPAPPESIDALFLAGKMLHAVLLDPFAYDLQVLDRFNQLLEVLDTTLDADDRARFDSRCIELRGAPYRRVDALVLSPSKDLGAMGIDFVRTHRRRFMRQGLGGFLLGIIGGRLAASGTDLASYLLFDGAFTTELIALGRADVAARADEVRAFFRRAATEAPTPMRYVTPQHA